MKEPVYTVCNVVFELMDEPKFPCLFVPIQGPSDTDWMYVWAKAEIVECRIRGAGHYFKIFSIANTKP